MSQKHAIEPGSSTGAPVPRVELPAIGSLFANRAARFARLAANHSMSDFLRLMARLAQAQHEVVAARVAAPLDAAHRVQCRQFGMPPLSAQAHPRAGWRDDLGDLAKRLHAGVEPAIAASLKALSELSADRQEALAERVLAGTTLNEDAKFVPFIGAALQVHFARAAAALDIGDVERGDVPSICPACGTRPVASVIRAGGGLRHAHCALCATEWNVMRIHCTACGSEGGVHYLSIGDAAAAVVKAEACDDCNTYLKVVSQEKDPQAEPGADDLATLMLDVLVDERGYTRSGPNLLFHPGSS
jgi:FdhE protein